MTMTHSEKRDLAARLVIHADHVERIGGNHPAYRYPQLVVDLKAAATELRTGGELGDRKP